MKILFIRGGNRGVDPISSRQGESLKNLGETVYYFDVVGKGLLGYLSNVFRLRKTISILRPDLIHAHYSFTGFLSSVSFPGKPIIVSLMGSDLYASGGIRLCITRFFSRNIWAATIVKTSLMYTKLNSSKAVVLPNGVDMVLFSQKSKLESMNNLGWDIKAKHFLFASDPERPEKNFNLAAQGIKKLKEERSNLILKIHYLKDIQPEEICSYYYAADVLLLTSFYEGSPNVIKEAMACNCPIVSTNVGDVEEVMKGTPGTFIVDSTIAAVTDGLIKALEYNKRTNGRELVKEYNCNVIALKLISIYKNVINDKR